MSKEQIIALIAMIGYTIAMIWIMTRRRKQ